MQAGGSARGIIRLGENIQIELCLHKGYIKLVKNP
jgi:hypothetical protein